MTDDEAALHRRGVLEALLTLSASQSELGRLFARSQHMHPTDAAAVVQIISSEDRGRPLTPARLAERVGLTTGATSILLNRLEEAGHITRQRGHRDRRTVTLHSSPAIHAKADAYYEPLAQRLSEVLASLSSTELELLQATVNSIRSSMEAYMADQESLMEGTGPTDPS